MKLLYTLSLSLLISIAYAQESDIQVLRASIEKDFAQVADKKFENLVPFRQNEKWGYLNKKSKKVVIAARYDVLDFFTPDMQGAINSLWFTVNKNGVVSFKETKVESEDESMYMAVEAESDYFRGISISSRKGFTVDANGKLTGYCESYHYNTSGFPTWNVMPFKRGSQYYAIVNNLQGEDALIDTEGNPVKGFEFKKYKEILLNRYAPDSEGIYWFFVKTDEKNYSLKSWDGRLKLENEIFTYPLLSSNLFGIDVIHKDDRYAVFDYNNLKWIIKPQTKLKLGHLKYSSSEVVAIDNPAHRDKASLYTWVEDGANAYYMDLKGNKYIPK